MSTSRFVAGALIGLVAGLLLAPEKGEDMREELAETAQKWKKKLERLAGKVGPELEDLKNMLGEQIEGLNDDVRSRILTILNESKDSAKKIKSNFSSEIN